MSDLDSLRNLYDSIPVLDETKAKLLQLEDMEKIHYDLTLDNPLTYFVFMDKRPDLSSHQRNLILKIIKKLQDNEKISVNAHCKDLK